MKRTPSLTTARYSLPDPGELKNQITLRRIAGFPGEDGIWPTIPEEIFVWSKIEQPGATTFQAGVQINDIVTHYFTIRYRRHIENNYEIVFRDEVFRIKRVRDLNNARRFLLMECISLGFEHPGGDNYG